ncbi:MAG: hypothetical protein CMB97_00955 [Flavobacteriaceae bacterium]|jgi:hypothetical protein|nr:hypothetical protein [Flavobacteriaceae bacterium]
MPVYDKPYKDLLKIIGQINFKGHTYIPDYIIELPLSENESINIDNSDCVYSIANPNNPEFRKYVGIRHFRKSTNDEKFPEDINGYSPKYIFCFTETKFPLEEFANEHNI